MIEVNSLFIIVRKRRLITILIGIVVAIALFSLPSFIRLNELANGLSSVIKNEPIYLLQIYIDEKRLYLLEDGKCIKQYPIATGTYEWPSPIGSWKIIEKGDWGEGFGGRWLGLNVTWGRLILDTF